MPSASLSYCGELVRANAHDWYLCALMTPAQQCEPRMVLAAFELEIRGISAKLGEEMVGFIRYAWWREALAGLYAGKQVAGHPVLLALDDVIKTYSLPRALLLSLVEAYEQAMAEKSASPATSGVLLQLYALLAGEAADAQHMALGQAWDAMQECLHHHNPALLEQAAQLLQQSEPVGALFRPFALAITFYLKRLAKGNPNHSRFRLPLMLWLRG